ncbi:unnamed protein product [Euphydryas editha]|uniref:Uncharacterized protein n=1 Tax=Euphydryas editha TaxID=104508 RepID=A0AAU9TWI5_EUPED|nr:unnamed protein product [Euphydryas editha]
MTLVFSTSHEVRPQVAVFTKQRDNTKRSQRLRCYRWRHEYSKTRGSRGQNIRPSLYLHAHERAAVSTSGTHAHEPRELLVRRTAPSHRTVVILLTIFPEN